MADDLHSARALEAGVGVVSRPPAPREAWVAGIAVGVRVSRREQTEGSNVAEGFPGLCGGVPTPPVPPPNRRMAGGGRLRHHPRSAVARARRAAKECPR